MFEMIKKDPILIIFVKKSAYMIRECSSFHYSLILGEKILTDWTIWILQKTVTFSTKFVDVSNISQNMNVK